MWTRRRYGPLAGIAAAALCAFDPNLIAHGRYVTTDSPVTAFFFFACVLWVEYLESGTWRRLIAAAVAIALALITKFSAILLIPSLVILYAACWIRRPREFGVVRLLVSWGTVLATVTVFVVAIYWPETLRCLHGGVPKIADLATRNNPIGEGLFRMGKRFGLPAHPYLLGLNHVADHNAGRTCELPVGAAVDDGLVVLLPGGVRGEEYDGGAGGDAGAADRGARSGMAAAVAFADGAGAGSASDAVFRLQHVERDQYRYAAHSAGVSLPVCGSGGMAVGAQELAARDVRAGGVGGAAGGRVRAHHSRLPGVFQRVRGRSREGAGIPGGFEYRLGPGREEDGDVAEEEYRVDAGARVSISAMRRCGITAWMKSATRTRSDQKGWDAVDELCVVSVTPLQGVYVPLDALAQMRLREPVAKIGWSMYVYDLRKKRM